MSQPVQQRTHAPFGAAHRKPRQPLAGLQKLIAGGAVEAVLLLGQVLVGMSEQDPPLDGAKNNPMMPIAWTRTYSAESGKSGRIFTTTMGSSQDMQNEAFRRMLVNAVFWALAMESKSPKKANVDLVGTFVPSPFGFGEHPRGRKPGDF